jgi:hypothetical protein
MSSKNGLFVFFCSLTPPPPPQTCKVCQGKAFNASPSVQIVCFGLRVYAMSVYAMNVCVLICNVRCSALSCTFYVQRVTLLTVVAHTFPTVSTLRKRTALE